MLKTVSISGGGGGGNGISITDTTANATYYITSSDVTSGAISTEYVTSTKFTWNPSSGMLNINGISAGRGNNSTSTNTVFGSGALTNNTTGRSSAAFGQNTLQSQTTGIFNVAVGAQAGSAITTGQRNIIIGYQAALVTSTTSNNTIIGYQALKADTASANNTVVGSSCLPQSTNGTNDTAVGFNAGALYGVSGNTGNNVFIGYNACADIDVVQNSVFIGASCQGASGSTGCVVIGYSEQSPGVNSNSIGTSALLTKLGGSILGTVTTVAGLATAVTALRGCRSFVTDALGPTFGATVVGGGAVSVPVYYDGTNWKVG